MKFNTRHTLISISGLTLMMEYLMQNHASFQKNIKIL